MRTTRKTVLFILLFFALWTAAWLVHNLLAVTIWPSLNDSSGQGLVYWAVMKVVVWVAFPVLFVSMYISPNNRRSFFGIRYTGRGILLGVETSVVWVALSCLSTFIQTGTFTFSLAVSATFIWVITGTPIAEEFTFRGVILPGIQKQGLSFWTTNLITAVLFLLIHVVGWSFQGSLIENVSLFNIASIVLVSLIAGWLRHKSGSLYPAIVFHAVNNFVSLVIG